MCPSLIDVCNLRLSLCSVCAAADDRLDTVSRVSYYVNLTYNTSSWCVAAAVSHPVCVIYIPHLFD